MNFLKRLFNKKEEREEPVLYIKIDELEGWLNEKFSNKYVNLKKYYGVIKENMNELKNNLNELENLEFRSDTDIAIKNRVKDNLNSYIHQLKLFINKIDTEIFFDYKGVKNYYDLVDFELNKLNKGTIKNFYISHSLFSKDLDRVALNLKNLYRNVQTLKGGVKNEESLIISEIYEDFYKLREKISLKKFLKSEIDVLEESYDNLKKEVDKINEKLISIKSSDEYNNYKNLENQKSDLERGIEKINNDVIIMFSNIERGLKKLNYIINSKLLDQYLNNPLTLFDDAELEIINFLSDLKDSIKSKKVDLKEKNSKTLESINLITKDRLGSLISDYNSKVNKLKEIKNQIINYQILKEFIEYNYKLNYNNNKLDILRTNIEKLGNRFDDINLEPIKKELENKIIKSTNKKISIII